MKHHQTVDDLRKLAYAKHGEERAEMLAATSCDRKSAWMYALSQDVWTPEQWDEHREWQRGLRDKFPWLGEFG